MFDPAVTDLEDWLRTLFTPTAAVEAAVLVLCGLAAWSLAAVISRARATRGRISVMFGQRVVDGVLFVMLYLLLGYLGKTLMHRWQPLVVFHIAIPALISLLVIRLGVRVTQLAFPEAPLVRAAERAVSWLGLVAVVLWVSGLLPLMLEELDLITWSVGGSRLSVRTLIEGVLTAGSVLIAVLWISSAIESRLLRAATGSELSLRKALSNLSRALLLFVGLLLSLSAVGIDLTALSVLGGAIGVGIGFGLQKLAANYVSGFVILAERSMRIGDNVRVDGFEGRITQINARYTVIRSLIGRESIVPNEMLITSRVENLSLADTHAWLSTTVTVGYDSDVEWVLGLLKQAAVNQARVLREPEPSVALMNFGADGLELMVGFWISDPENGSDNLRSLVNLDILRALREHGIDIPYPQRVVHTRTS